MQPFSKHVCTLQANKFARKASKILCMRSIGEIVAAWRVENGLEVNDLAALVSKQPGGGKPVSRQNIEQLESGHVQQPRYLARLARAMGCTADDLLAGKSPPKLAAFGARPPNQSLSAGEPAPAAYVPGLDHGSMRDCVTSIAKLLRGLNGVPRAMAATAIKHLADNPDHWRDVSDQLDRLADEARKANAA